MPDRRPVALVTGASVGIGSACAGELARVGFRVFGTSRHPSPDTDHPPIRMLALDVRDDCSVKQCVEDVLAEYNRIDVLVNNAGISTVGALEETTMDEFLAVLDTNLFGAVRMIRAVLPVMRSRHAGRIVNMGSVMGFLPMPYSAAYCASKHAIRGLSESVDHEVRPFGIRVVTIEPGPIRTEIVRHSAVCQPMQAYARREVAFELAARGIEQGADPAVVARAVVEAATTLHPQSRYLPDTTAWLMQAARRFLPSGCFDSAMRSYFRLD